MNSFIRPSDCCTPHCPVGAERHTFQNHGGWECCKSQTIGRERDTVTTPASHMQYIGHIFVKMDGWHSSTNRHTAEFGRCNAECNYTDLHVQYTVVQLMNMKSIFTNYNAFNNPGHHQWHFESLFYISVGHNFTTSILLFFYTYCGITGFCSFERINSRICSTNICHIFQPHSWFLCTPSMSLCC